MRLWIIHPKYLDCKGLVALWREGLLARKVLEGKTRGYRHHPQLKIFKSVEDPIVFIDTYLSYVFLFKMVCVTNRGLDICWSKYTRLDTWFAPLSS